MCLIEYLYFARLHNKNKVFDPHQDPFVHLALLSGITRTPPS